MLPRKKFQNTAQRSNLDNFYLLKWRESDIIKTRHSFSNIIVSYTFLENVDIYKTKMLPQKEFHPFLISLLCLSDYLSCSM